MTTKEISDATLLFIRACKSDDSIRNIMRVYRKYYYFDRESMNIPYQHLVVILTKIVEEYATHMTASRWIEALNPHDGWKYGVSNNPVSYNYSKHVTMVLISIIRLLPVACFPRYPVPCKMRREFKGERP